MTQLDLTTQTRATYETSMPETAGGIVASVLLASGVWSQQGDPRIGIWLLVALSVYLLRAALAGRYRHRTRSASSTWVTLYAMGAAVTGAAWGGAGTLLLGSGDGSLLMMVGTGIGLMLVWASYVYSASTLALLAFVVTAAGPSILTLYQGDHPGRITGMVLLTLTALLSLLLGRLVGSSRVQSLAMTDELKQTESLLAQRADQVERLNQALKSNFEQRQSLEQSLSEKTLALEKSEQKVRMLSGAIERMNDSCPITGLKNRRKLEEVLDLEWRRTLRQPRPVSLLVACIDDFRDYQQAHGQKPTELMLNSVAKLVAQTGHRPEDVPARYSDDQIALLLPGAAAEAARRIAEKLRAKVEAQRIPHNGNPARSFVTVHVAVATVVPVKTLKSRELMRRLESTLYEGEFRGGNRVLAFDALESVVLERWQETRDGTLGKDAMLQKFLVAGLEPQHQIHDAGSTVVAEKTLQETLIYGMLSGELRLQVDGHEMVVRAGDSVRIPAGVTCSIVAGGSSATVCLHAAEPAEDIRR